MEIQVIFLSYRRQNIPRHVGRLTDYLEAAFGQTVFRDLDSIGGGNDRKIMLNKAVSEAEIISQMLT